MIYRYFLNGRIVTHTSPDLQTPFRKLSNEQNSFFESNPTASAQEIEACALNTISLEDYIASKINELSALSLSTSYNLIPEYQRDNLLSGVEGLPYTLIQLKQLNTDCRVEFYRVKALIEAATTIQEVDTAFNLNNYSTITL